VAIITTFKPNLARITAPIYAVLEGIALGGISFIYEAQFKGIPLIAVGLTFGVALAMLALYATRIIRVTDRLRSVIIGATVGIFFFYLITLILGFFHIQMPGVFGFGWAGLLFSSAVVIVAAMNLLLNFDTIERNAGSAPQQMEWYAAFGMLVTLVWLYLELAALGVDRLRRTPPVAAFRRSRRRNVFLHHECIAGGAGPRSRRSRPTPASARHPPLRCSAGSRAASAPARS